MPTIYSTRTIPTTSYSIQRIGGSYLLDSLGRYVLSSVGQRIIVPTRGGTLPITSYSVRPSI